jgi:parvulin-like peptidyl-prolyl isomerase
MTAGGDSDPSIPPGAIAVIEDTPDGTIEITKAEFSREFDRVALEEGLEPPQPGEYRYAEFKGSAVKGLIEPVWVVGQAKEAGLGLTPEELSREVRKAKDKQFDSKAEFKAALRRNHDTEADFAASVEQQVLIDRVQKWLEDKAPEPSRSEIEGRYAELTKDFEPTPEERTFRYIVNKDRAKAEKALEMVDVDYTYHPQWEKAARLYSEDPETKDKGGQQTVTQGELPDALDELVFSAKSDEPPPERVIDTPEGFVVFELQSIDEAVEKPTLEENEDDYKKELQPKLTSEFIGEFGSEYQDRWRSRTFCAPGYVIDLCANG